MKGNARKAALIAVGFCAGLSMQNVAAAGASTLGKPAEFFFAAPPPEFKSAGERVSGDDAIEADMNKAVLAALKTGDVKYLEATSIELLHKKEITPTGYLKIGLFIDAITNATQEKTEDGKIEIEPKLWSTALGTVTNWSRQYPKSSSAWIAIARIHMARAWSLRGTAYASEVPREQWVRFEKEVSKASDILQASASFSKENPVWYSAYVSIATVSSLNRQAYMSVIEESLKTHPESLEVAVNGVEYMLPRWGGSDESVRNYISRVTSLVSEKNAPIVYARLYRRLLRRSFYDAQTVVPLAGANLVRLKRSYELLVKRYPDPYNEDAQAATLCNIGDKEGLRHLLNKIGDSPILNAWSSSGKADYFLSCRQYARQQ